MSDAVKDEPKVKEYWCDSRGMVHVVAVRPDGHEWAIDYERDLTRFRLGLRRFSRDFGRLSPPAGRREDVSEKA